jgi:hypothetical protein
MESDSWLLSVVNVNYIDSIVITSIVQCQFLSLKPETKLYHWNKEKATIKPLDRGSQTFFRGPTQ